MASALIVLDSLRMEDTAAQTSSEASSEERSNEQILVTRALQGDAEAMRGLVAILRAPVQAEVGWTLHRFASGARGRDPRQELADMVQEVFLALFDHDGRILRAWDPVKGRTLINFVKLVARHQVVSLLRSRRRCPWTEDPTPIERLALVSIPSSEQQLAEADSARQLVAGLREELSTRSMMMFEGLYVEDRSVDEVCSEFGLTRDALYAWRTRLKRKIEKIARRLGIGAGDE